MVKKKLGAFVLICTNENKDIVSCDGYKTKEEAERAMMKAFDTQTDSYMDEGYSCINIRRELGMRSATVGVGESDRYEWIIKEI